ncbi:MAG: hypothetical protein WCO45_09755 [Pseudanabaena sp. ELA607]
MSEEALITQSISNLVRKDHSGHGGFMSTNDDNSHYFDLSSHSITELQETIYQFFLDGVSKQTPDYVMHQFQRLFIYYQEISSQRVYNAVGALLFFGNEQEFHYTLLRCCYILVNNWILANQYSYVQALIAIFKLSDLPQNTRITKLNILHQWLRHFIKTKEFANLLMLTGNSVTRIETHPVMAERFRSYLLTAQALEADTHQEQKQLAQIMAHRIKKQFKFDLAMYTAHLAAPQSLDRSLGVAQGRQQGRIIANPTGLGEHILHLLKVMLTRQQGANLKFAARQVRHLLATMTVGDGKKVLIDYLALNRLQREPQSDSKSYQENINLLLEVYFIERIDQFQINCDDQLMSAGSLHTLTKRMMQNLLVHQQHQPSPLLVALLNHGYTLSLVSWLLRIVLVCPISRQHLEITIAHLISYYSQYPPENSYNFIQFVDILSVGLAIFDADTDYNLVRVNQEIPEPTISDCSDDYRIFSQFKPNVK